MPSSIPQQTTDSIGWHDWYNNLLSRDCFIPIKYATSEHKTLAENSPTPYLFIPTTKENCIFQIAIFGMQKGNID